MRKWLPIVTLLILSLAASTDAIAKAVRLPDTKISINMRNVGLRDTLDGLLVKSGIRYRIAESVTNEEKLSIQIEDAAWADIFKFLVEQSELDYRTDQAGRLILEKRQRRSL